ncbi:serine hydrolase domain-containing protein [Flavobacterium lindanitolerans]|jgi:CubicO group peptidase (beta-lactamase class C family)|uniref:serine hydrolase domain-containing protein n=1 Tax=Flavobacterium lindanitolerans TaxID=428988 RepID=UPI0023F0B4ED|nr:serine hydrolase domain-containing protein [Flavobacterium lindanitolerans]
MKQFTLFFMLLIISNFAYAQKKQSERLDSLFTVLYQQNQFNGTALIAEKGKIIFKKSYGIANEDTKAPINEKTIFELASCSKQFTATAIVLLKREGKLQYTDKISKYLPELGFWENVTIYDLLRHTSGIPDFLKYMPDNWDHNKIADNNDLIKVLAAKKDTLEFTPKSRHSYSNSNYILLGSIVEKVSGKKFPDFLSDRVFKPLKMKNTFVYCRHKYPKKIDNFAYGYVWEDGGFKKILEENSQREISEVYYLDAILGTSKVHSNAEDLYTWMTSLKNNTLLTKKEFDEMTEITKTSNGRDVAYGFGLDLRKGENKFTFGHTGSWDGYSTFMLHDVVKDRTFIILQNFHFGAVPYTNMFQIMEDKPLQLQYPKKIALSDDEIAQYTGTYTNEEGETHIITSKEKHLLYNTPTVSWNMRFFPYSNHEFRGIRQAGADAVLNFTKLDNGDIKLEMFQDKQIVGTGVRKGK